MRVRRLTATLALSALALSGCSGEGDGEESTSSTVEPTVIDPSSDSSSASSSSTSSSGGSESSTSSTSEADADGPPEEAKANTKEGAEAFAKWYWEESGDALTDGDTAELRSAAAPDCEVCLEAIRLKDENAEKYGLVETNPHKISVIRSAQDKQGIWRVKLKVEFPDYRYIKDGKSQAVVKADSYEINPRLERTAEGWLVRDWLLVQ